MILMTVNALLDLLLILVQAELIVQLILDVMLPVLCIIFQSVNHGQVIMHIQPEHIEEMIKGIGFIQ